MTTPKNAPTVKETADSLRDDERPATTVKGAEMPSPLLVSVRSVHGRDTCDEAGRPLSTYTCEYHQGYEDALDWFTEHYDVAPKVRMVIPEGSSWCLPSMWSKR